MSPISFDIIKFLILAEAKKNDIDAAIIHLFIVPPSKQRTQQLLDRYQINSSSVLTFEFFTKRIKNIIFEATKLFPSIKSVTLLASRDEAKEHIKNDVARFPASYQVCAPIQNYSIEYVQRLLRSGKVPPSLSVPEDSKAWALELIDNAKNTISITLRDTPYETWRNSRIEHWILFAKLRLNEGYRIIWLGDVEGSMHKDYPLPGQVHLPNSILHNAVIYQVCCMNFFVNGGTAALARFNHHAKSVCFKLLDNRSGATGKNFWLGKGIMPGKQLTYLSPNHYQYWNEDSIDNLNKVWGEWCLPILKTPTNCTRQALINWSNKVCQFGKLEKTSLNESLIPSLPVYIWGVSEKAKKTADKLATDGFNLTGFIDSFAYGEVFNGSPVLHPSELSASIPKNIVLVPISSNGLDITQKLLDFIDICYPQRGNLVHFSSVAPQLR